MASDLRDALTVTGEVPRRQAAVQLGRAEWLERLQKGQELHQARARYIDERLAEITDKLHGLIGYIDNTPRHEPPPA